MMKRRQRKQISESMKDSWAHRKSVEAAMHDVIDISRDVAVHPSKENLRKLRAALRHLDKQTVTS